MVEQPKRTVEPGAAVVQVDLLDRIVKLVLWNFSSFYSDWFALT